MKLSDLLSLPTVSVSLASGVNAGNELPRNEGHMDSSVLDEILDEEVRNLDSYIEMPYGEVTPSDPDGTPDAQQAAKDEIYNFIIGQMDELAAKENLSSNQKARLQKVLLDNIDAFGSKRVVNSMSILQPMPVQLKPGSQPIVMEARNMGPVMKETMRKSF